MVVPFNDLTRASTERSPPIAFSEPGPYTAEIVGLDGTVLRQLAVAMKSGPAPRSELIEIIDDDGDIRGAVSPDHARRYCRDRSRWIGPVGRGGAARDDRLRC